MANSSLIRASLTLVMAAGALACILPKVWGICVLAAAGVAGIAIEVVSALRHSGTRHPLDNSVDQ